MSDARTTLSLVGLAATMLGAVLYGHGHGAPDPSIMLVVLVAAMAAGIAGLAFSALSCAILLHLMPDTLRVLQLVALCSVSNQLLTVWCLRRDIVWRDMAGLVAGGLAGIVPGLWTLLHVQPQLVARGIGAVMMVYAVHLALGEIPAVRTRSRWADAAVGFAASATGAVSTLPSLPVTMWCQARGYSKQALRATVQPFVLAVQIVTVPLLAHAAPESAIGAADLLCVPASLLGTQIGLGCVRGLSNRQFALAVATLSAICGVSFWL